MSNSGDCPSFKRCSASLCPLDPDSLEHGIWYPDEPICKYHKINKLSWIKTQRRLSKKALPDFYFTYEMLTHKFVIRKGIKGLDPNIPENQEKTELKKWFSTHPELTSEQLERLKEKGRDLKKIGVSFRKLEKKCAKSVLFGGVKKGGGYKSLTLSFSPLKTRDFCGKKR